MRSTTRACMSWSTACNSCNNCKSSEFSFPGAISDNISRATYSKIQPYISMSLGKGVEEEGETKWGELFWGWNLMRVNPSFNGEQLFEPIKFFIVQRGHPIVQRMFTDEKKWTDEQISKADHLQIAVDRIDFPTQFFELLWSCQHWLRGVSEVTWPRVLKINPLSFKTSQNLIYVWCKQVLTATSKLSLEKLSNFYLKKESQCSWYWIQYKHPSPGFKLFGAYPSSEKLCKYLSTSQQLELKQWGLLIRVYSSSYRSRPLSSMRTTHQKY